jgi:hypothetical protein
MIMTTLGGVAKAMVVKKRKARKVRGWDFMGFLGDISGVEWGGVKGETDEGGREDGKGKKPQVNWGEGLLVGEGETGEIWVVFREKVG